MRLPRFFILGVQKAGTTTLARLLDATPGLAMTEPKEPMFFCCDDMNIQFSNLFRRPSSWQRFDWENRKDDLLAEYSTCCEHAPEGAFVGDGSTTTLLSRRALARIAETLPGARHIVLLRDPVKRAYSAYWHAIRTGLHAESFESALRSGRDCLLRFGHYEAHLRQLFEFFPREQVMVMHFEDLARDQKNCWKEAAAFLGRPMEEVPQLEAAHANAAFYPRSLTLHRWLARLQGIHNDTAPPVTWLPPEEKKAHPMSSSGLRKQAKELYRMLLMTDRKPVAPHPDTVRVLRDYYRRENRGLGKLLERDVFGLWGWND